MMTLQTVDVELIHCRLIIPRVRDFTFLENWNDNLQVTTPH